MIRQEPCVRVYINGVRQLYHHNHLTWDQDCLTLHPACLIPTSSTWRPAWDTGSSWMTNGRKTDWWEQQARFYWALTRDTRPVPTFDIRARLPGRKLTQPWRLETIFWQRARRGYKISSTRLSRKERECVWVDQSECMVGGNLDKLTNNAGYQRHPSLIFYLTSRELCWLFLDAHTPDGDPYL